MTSHSAGYFQLTEIEQAFQEIKGDLAIRAIYQKLEFQSFRFVDQAIGLHWIADARTLPRMNSIEASVALNMIPGVGPVRLRRLMDRFGGPEDVLRASAADLAQTAGVGPEVAYNIAHWESLVDLKAELALAESLGVHILTPACELYPRSLKEIHDPPIVLYCKGEIVRRDHHAVAVVGTRRPTNYGTETTKKLSYQLAYSGITVISGLALGVDTAAHLAALAAKGRTIAVLGSGIAELYPPSNRELAERIAESGAVVSEFPLRTKPDKQSFPMRNRIVSGWSFGVLVVECALKSGALITANQASDQGRSIYAVPGPIDRPSSQGTNRLIQQGAKLVMSAADILDDMQILFPEQPTLQNSRPQVDMNEQETAIYNSIGLEETHINLVITKSGLPSGVVSSTLLALQLKRLVKQLPGNHYVKLL